MAVRAAEIADLAHPLGVVDLLVLASVTNKNVILIQLESQTSLWELAMGHSLLHDEPPEAAAWLCVSGLDGNPHCEPGKMARLTPLVEQANVATWPWEVTPLLSGYGSHWKSIESMASDLDEYCPLPVPADGNGPLWAILGQADEEQVKFVRAQIAEQYTDHKLRDRWRQVFLPRMGTGGGSRPSRRGSQSRQA
jgi:hypothetical protein